MTVSFARLSRVFRAPGRFARRIPPLLRATVRVLGRPPRWAWRRRMDALEIGGFGLASYTLWAYLDPLAGGLFGAVAMVYIANGGFGRRE